MISARVEAALRSNHPGDVAGLMGLLAAEPRVGHAALAGPDGRVLYATEIIHEGGTLAEAGFGRARTVIEHARKTDRVQAEVLHDPPLVVSAAPIQLPTPLGVPPRHGVLVAEHELARALAQERIEAVHRALLQGATFLGASLLLYLMLHIAVLRRLWRLEKASKRLARGDYGARAELRGHDELAVLGRSFDRMASDIGARDRALRDEANRTESLLRNLNDAILVVDQTNVIRQATGGAARTFGVPTEEMVGRPVAALLHPDDRAGLEEALSAAQTMEMGTLDLERRAVPGPSGPARFLEVRIAPAASEQVGGVVVTVRDITERRQLQAEIELRQKMELVSQLAGGVAHDFNNLLSAIMLSAEAAIARSPAGSREHDLLVNIYETSIRGGALTRQLLSLGRRDLSKTGPIDVNAVIGELESLVRRLVPSNVELELELHPEPCWIRANEGLIEQVLINLLVNARDAMPDGGHLCVRTRRQRSGQDGCWRVAVQVSDTGVGIDPEIRPRIFEPLVTTKAAGKGTGLGLATVHSVVNDLGGEIDLESTVGEGSRFTLTFPAVGAAEQTDSPAKVAKPRKGSETVLYVEDDAPIRNGVARALADSGYRVIACGSAESALQQLPGLADEVAVLATDLMLPGIDGLELWRRACEIVPGLPVVFMSGYTELAMRRDLERGEHTVLQKPLDGRKVATALRSVIDGARHRRSRPAPTVLLVDDDDLVRRAIEAALDEGGYRTLTAVNGEDAVDQFRRHSGELDVVLLDMSMPRKSGLEVLADLAAIDPKVPVVACSGASSPAISEALSSGRLAGFVQKPYQISALLGALEAALGTQSARLPV